MICPPRLATIDRKDPETVCRGLPISHTEEQIERLVRKRLAFREALELGAFFVFLTKLSKNLGS